MPETKRPKPSDGTGRTREDEQGTEWEPYRGQNGELTQEDPDTW